MAIVDDLKTRRAAVAAKIASLATDSLDMPNASGSHAVDYEKHKQGLYRELKELDEAIERHDTSNAEVVSYGVI